MVKTTAISTWAKCQTPLRQGIYGLLLLMLLQANFSFAAEPEISVSHQKGQYQIALKVDSPLPPQTVYARLTDFSNLQNISPAIRKSRVLPHRLEGKKLVMTLAHGCVWFFCKSVQKVEKITSQNTMMISTEIVPGRSDFSMGKARWLIMKSDRGSKIEYYASMQPSFSVPPMIGPHLMKQWLHKQLQVIANRLSTHDLIQ